MGENLVTKIQARMTLPKSIERFLDKRERCNGNGHFKLRYKGTYGFGNGLTVKTVHQCLRCDTKVYTFPEDKEMAWYRNNGKPARPSAVTL